MDEGILNFIKQTSWFEKLHKSFINKFTIIIDQQFF